MKFDRLAWLFVLVFAVHNIEEGLFIAGYLHLSPLWHPDAVQFDFSLVGICLPAPGLAWLAVNRNAATTYLLCGMALAMLLNVFLPHLLGTIALRRYMPGVVTAVTLVLPVTALLLRQAFREGRIVLKTFAWAGPLTVVAMAASLPALFALEKVVIG